MIYLEEVYAKIDCPTCGSNGTIGSSPSGSANDPDMRLLPCPSCGTSGIISIAFTFQPDKQGDRGDRWVLEVETEQGHLHDVYIDIQGAKGEPGVNWYTSKWADGKRDNILNAVDAAMNGRKSPLHIMNVLESEGWS